MKLPNIRFFGSMSLLYISLGIVWAGSYVRYWKEASTLQHCVTAVVALGMMEMSTWCAASCGLELGSCRWRPCSCSPWYKRDVLTSVAAWS